MSNPLIEAILKMVRIYKIKSPNKRYKYDNFLHCLEKIPIIVYN